MAEPALENILHAALLAAGEPLSVERLQRVFPEESMPERGAVETALQRLAQRLAGTGVELHQVASGYRLQVPPAYAPWVARLWEESAGEDTVCAWVHT